MTRSRRALAVACGLVTAVLPLGCSRDSSPAGSARRVVAERLRVEVVAVHPHDPRAFTEGLVFSADGSLYESTGLYGKSTIRRVDAVTGEVLASSALEPSLFGEGIAVVGASRLVQLTWKEGRALSWSLPGLSRTTGVRYDGEGWGLTVTPDGQRLVMSDGSAALSHRDPDSFVESGRVQVVLDGRPVERLNELETVGGEILANVWQTDQIVRVDAASGAVTAVIDASGLLTSSQRAEADVLNGIAHRPGDPADRLWVTGKNWPSLFEVRLVPA